MRKTHWVMAAGCVLAAVGGLFLTSTAEGQKRRPFPPMEQPVALNPGLSATQYSGIKLDEDSTNRGVIEAARDYVRAAEKLKKEGKREQAHDAWKQAVTALQHLLDKGEDSHVQVRQRDANGQETVRWASMKFEANNLLGSMPTEGLEIYNVMFGGKAKQLLDEAKERGDREILADVASRYQHTTAGIEATELLATHFLNRGQFFMAALRYERLLDMNPDRAKVSDLTLYKAALAMIRAGDKKRSDAAWKKLEDKLGANGVLTTDKNEKVSVAQLAQTLKDAPQPATLGTVHDWTMWFGNPSRSAQAVGSQPLLDMSLFTRKLVTDVWDEGKGKEADAKIAQAIQNMSQIPNTPILSGFSPIALGNVVIYRSYHDVRAVYLKDLKDAEGKVIVKAGELAWKTNDLDGSLATLLNGENNRVAPTANMWLNTFFQQPGFANLIYENSLQGAIATDHRFLYLVDDLAVPAPSNIFQPFVWNQQQLPAELKNLVMGNSLQAYELATEGKLSWRLGDPLKKAADDPFADSHFLGVPIMVGGKLYVLNEKNNGQPAGDSDLRLVCIDPSTGKLIGSPQNLGSVVQQYRITHDHTRRMNAVHLAYGEGILVCPTNAGEVLGVDLLSRTLAWAYPYREKPPGTRQVNPGQPFPGQPFPGMGQLTIANWKSSPPVIADGKVVFTAPDANSVHCVNLRDGTKVWSKAQADGDQFLGGVFNGKVVIVGKNAVRLLKLSDGAQVAFLPTGDVPSGQGVASKNIYYLPLKKGEIIGIDLERNAIKARNRAIKPGTTAPGNLVFHDGNVISVTPRELVVYPQLTARLEEASKALDNDPNNPEKLYERGMYRLADGQVQGAVDDLQGALQKNPAGDLLAKVKRQYYDALTDLFQMDFDKASARYMDDFQTYSKAEEPAEHQQRQSKFFRIVGQGREQQGKLSDAYQSYKAFAELPINQQGIANVEDPTHKVPTSIWLKGRIAAMMAKATPEQREPLEAKIADEWKQVQAKAELGDIRKFVGMFDVPFGVGREARLELAQAIMKQNQAAAYLEAELSLQQLRVGQYRSDAKIGGRALAALIALEEKKGKDDNMKLAAAYRREIAREFPDTVVADGKKGKDFINELAQDKRYWPFLEEGSAFPKDAKMASHELPAGTLAPGLQGFILYPEGDLTPAMKNLRLFLDPARADDPQVRIVDMANNSTRGSLGLGSVPANYMLYQQIYTLVQSNSNPTARFRFFKVKGHLAVLQVGVMAYGIDLHTMRELWRHELYQIPQMHQVQQIAFDSDGNLEYRLFHQQTGQQTVARIGSVGAVEASYVALIGNKGLIVVDPLTGKEMWSKSDVPARTQVFGDNEHLYLLETFDGGSAGAGRCLRASDGVAVEVPDFGSIYQNRLHIDGRKILAAATTREGVTLRLYDAHTGKDVWSRKFDPRAVALRTEDPKLTGVIDPDANKLIVLNSDTGKELFSTAVIQKLKHPSGKEIDSRVTFDDLKNLKDPLLFADGERYYVALNQALDANEVAGGMGSNFTNCLRCAVVNGWLVAYHRSEDAGKMGEREINKGDLIWTSRTRLANQMVLLDQFQNMPVIVLSSRYNKMINGGAGGNQWVSLTYGLSKKSGKMVYESEPRFSNGQPTFFAFMMEPKSGSINLVGAQLIVQFYIDDGRKVENKPQPAPGPGPGPGPRPGLPGGGAPGFPGAPGAPGLPGGILPGNGVMPVFPPGVLPVDPNGRIRLQPLPVLPNVMPGGLPGGIRLQQPIIRQLELLPERK